MSRVVTLVPRDGGPAVRYGLCLPKLGTIADVRTQLETLRDAPLAATLVYKLVYKFGFEDELDEKVRLERVGGDDLVVYELLDEPEILSAHGVGELARAQVWCEGAQVIVREEAPATTAEETKDSASTAVVQWAGQVRFVSEDGSQVEVVRLQTGNRSMDVFGPSFHPPLGPWAGDPQDLVGAVIEVRWDEHGRKVWYRADVTQFFPDTGKHKAIYQDDGEEKTYTMSRKHFRVIRYPPVVYPADSPLLSVPPPELLHLDVDQRRPMARSWYGSGSTAPQRFAMPFIASTTSNATNAQLHDAVWIVARRFVAANADESKAGGDGCGGGSSLDAPYRLVHRDLRGVDTLVPVDDAPIPRELATRMPGQRGTTNILIVLWDDASSFSESAAEPADDTPSIEAMAKRGADINLGSLLDMYEESEQEAEWGPCPKCKGMGCSISTSFWKLPDVLVVTLKRFDFAAGRKIASPVKFEPEIDLAHWLQDSERDGRETVFEVFGIVNHYGSMRFGHYTAFCKRKEGWFEFDDRAVHDKVVFDYSAAYVLFLRRKGLK